MTSAGVTGWSHLDALHAVFQSLSDEDVIFSGMEGPVADAELNVSVPSSLRETGSLAGT